MSEHNETLAEIVAEMRRFGQRHWMHDEGQNIRLYADRIEAAWKRQEQCYLDQIRDAVNMIGHERFVKEHPSVGNAAAMRETLEQLSDEVCDYLQKGLIQLPLPIEDLLKQARAALAKPPRNCDLPLRVNGPANNNADKAWRAFRHCCPDAYFDVPGLLRCINWLLAPAKEQRGECNEQR